MTERTVTIQTEEEQTITLCDQCGLSDDAGELVTYKVSQTSSNANIENVRDYDSLHLHRGCLEDLGVGVPDEMDRFERAFKDTHVTNEVPTLAFSWQALLFTFVGLVVGSLGLYSHDYFLAGSGAFVMVVGVSGAIDETRDAIRRLNNV